MVPKSRYREIFMIAFQTLIRRTAAALGAIAALTGTGLATAQTVTLTGASGSSCTYSQMTVLPNGNVAVTCTTVAGPGTFTLTAPSSLSTSSQTTTQIRVNRANGSAGEVTVPFSTGGTSSCTSATATPVTFADGDLAGKYILIDTTAATGTCVVTLLAPSAGSLGTPSSKSMSVVDPNADVTFAFATTSSSASVADASVQIVVNRSGGTANAWTVPVALSGGLTSSGSLISGTGTTSPGAPVLLQFAANSSSATLTYAPPSATPATPALPASLVLTLGLPTSSTAVGQTGTSVAPLAHTVTLNGPAVGCPVPQTVANSLGGTGNTITTRLSSGAVGTFVLPTPILGKTTGLFKLSETTVTFPLAPWSYEIHINKCRGLVQATPGDGCYATSSNKTLFNKVWFTQFVAAFPNKAKMDTYGYCYAPPGEGPWYVNVRYNYAGCSTAPCGWHAQWTNWSY